MILTKPLPTELEICGRGYHIDTHFSTWLRFDKLFKRPNISSSDMLILAHRMVFRVEPEITADSILEIYGQLQWFYACGRDVTAKPDDDDDEARRVSMDYDKDAPYIAAAFMQAYGIDLFHSDLHWWLFQAYLAAIPEDTALSRIIGYRVADTSKMSKDMRAHYIKMRMLFSLEGEESEGYSDDMAAKIARINRQIESDNAKRTADGQTNDA